MPPVECVERPPEYGAHGQHRTHRQHAHGANNGGDGDMLQAMTVGDVLVSQ